MQKYIDGSFDLDDLVEYLIEKQDEYILLQSNGSECGQWTEVEFANLKATLEGYFK